MLQLTGVEALSCRLASQQVEHIRSRGERACHLLFWYMWRCYIILCFALVLLLSECDRKCDPSVNTPNSGTPAA